MPKPTYKYARYANHWIVYECIDGIITTIIAHCDTPAECKEEIELLNNH